MESRSGTRTPAVTATLASPALPAVSIVGQIAAGADCPSVPPGVVIPVVVGALPAWRPNRRTASLALFVGLSIGVGALTTPDTGDHRSWSGDGLLLVSSIVEITALVGIVAAGALAVPRLGRRKAVGS